MPKVKTINGINIHAIKQVNSTRKAKISNFGSATSGVTKRATLWTCKFERTSNNRWVCYHTGSGYTLADPYSETDYAPSSSWTAMNVNGYDAGAMAAMAYGETDTGIGWFGSCRHNDTLRNFMHATASTIIDGTYPWPYDAGGSPAPQSFQNVAFGAVDRVWVLGKKAANMDSLCISYSDPSQTNNQMTWERVANLATGDAQNAKVKYCEGRKYSVMGGARFWINTGSVSSSVADVNQWVKNTDAIGFTPSEYCYGNTPADANGRFVAVGASNDIRFSTDNGSTWTAASSVAGSSVQLTNVCYDSRRDIFVAVGYSGRILTSSNGGVDWGDVTPDPAPPALWWVATDGFNCVATGNDRRILVSSGSLATFVEIPVPTTPAGAEILSTADSYGPVCSNIIVPV